MPDLPSRLDLFEVGKDYVLQRAQKIDPEQVDVQGSDVNIAVGSTSTLAFQIVKQLAYAINRLLLDGAEGEDLDRYGYDRYQLPRKGAAPALGSVTFTRPTAAVGAGSIPADTLLVTDTGAQYTTTSLAVFGVSDLVSSANVRAVQAGPDTQVAAHEIIRFQQSSLVFDQSITVDNPLPTAGGDPREDDDTYRNRIRDFWNSARRGTLAAIEFGAKTVPGVTSAQALEAVTQGNTPARVVVLYIADKNGVSSKQLGDQVLVALQEYRAGGIAVLINTSLPELVSVVLKLVFRANVDTVTLTSQVIGAVIEFINSLPVNAPLVRFQLGSVLQRYVDSGLIVSQDSIVAPAGDVVPDAGFTLRTTPALVQAA